MLEPDELFIEFLRPDLVIQDGTFDELGQKYMNMTVPIVRQMTKERHEELVLLDQGAEKVSWFLTVLEFCAFFLAGKTISAMWSLILTI